MALRTHGARVCQRLPVILSTALRPTLRAAHRHPETYLDFLRVPDVIQLTSKVNKSSVNETRVLQPITVPITEPRGHEDLPTPAADSRVAGLYCTPGSVRWKHKRNAGRPMRGMKKRVHRRRRYTRYLRFCFASQGINYDKLKTARRGVISGPRASILDKIEFVDHVNRQPDFDLKRLLHPQSTR